jgi:hypothetical protein
MVDPWLRSDQISAALARDVVARHGHELDDLTKTRRSPGLPRGTAEVAGDREAQQNNL